MCFRLINRAGLLRPSLGWKKIKKIKALKMGIMSAFFFNKIWMWEDEAWDCTVDVADCVKSAGRLLQTTMKGEESPRSHLASVSLRAQTEALVFWEHSPRGGMWGLMRSGRYKETTPFRIPACDQKHLQDPPMKMKREVDERGWDGRNRMKEEG